MKKILFFAFLFMFASISSFSQVFNPNNYGIQILSVNEAGIVQVALPNGTTYNIKAIIQSSGKDRGRARGDGFIMDVPVIAQIEWDINQQKNVPSTPYYNQAGGFTALSATAYYVEMHIDSDGKKQYDVLQAIGQWENVPDLATWAKWYWDQPQPIKNFSRVVKVLKTFPSENTQAFVIGL